ncbi:MAG: hypothetical protein L6R28_22365 [Planctomycetes bacterium]|nr:hypothetical protein [Planctomycetota bacterium]
MMRMPSRTFCPVSSVFLLLLAGALRAGDAPDAAPEPARWAKRWVYVSSNLYVNENLAKLEALFKRAKAAGYTAVLFTDYKAMTWWKLDTPKRWEENAKKLRALTRGLGLELHVCVMPFGYADSLLFHDPNLANGTPVKDAPLAARDGILAPEATARIENGGFELSANNRAQGFGFQDDPGKGSFIDTAVFKEGKASLRFQDVGQANPHGHGRINVKVKVRPWTQYRLRVWLKAEHLTADEARIMVLADRRTLQWQYIPYLVDGQVRHLSGARDFSMDWVEASVTFNSLEYTEVGVYLGLWGGKGGRIWFDDLRLDDAPALNLLRRDNLPLKIDGEDGTIYEEGKDFARIVDPGLGVRPWKGNFDTLHEPPEIRLVPGSRIKEGQRVRFSAYHATLVHEAQVNCSLAEERVFTLCAEQLRRLKEVLAPDGWFLSHDEIRSAGWEPAEQAKLPATGACLAENIRRCFALAKSDGGGLPAAVWSDMFDPNHNARADYYLVANTLAGSWEGLPKDALVMKWGGGEIARPGLEFFARRGHKQMIAAFYDGDPKKDRAAWAEAAKGVANVEGVMYTTWRNDYSKLEEFAELWWGGAKAK